MKPFYIITHLPCSCGTTLTSFITSSCIQSSVLVPETTPILPFWLSKKSFLPNSPLCSASFFCTDLYPLYLENYLSQITSLCQYCIVHNLSLVLRLHLWEPLFSAEKLSQWISVIDYIFSFNRDSHIIYTSRDILQNWHSLRKNFPAYASQTDFPTLALANIKFCTTLSKIYPVNFVRIEHCISDLKAIFPESMVDINALMHPILIDPNTISSGYSGRSYSQLTVPKPHLTSYHQLIRDISSKAYKDWLLAFKTDHDYYDFVYRIRCLLFGYFIDFSYSVKKLLLQYLKR